ncbi:hypothetical protein Tco_0142783 [Tanacetum coccineum]
MTPPPGFSTPPQIPNISTSERPPVTTTMFSATTPQNTPFAYHASILTNLNPMISPAFTRNEDLRTELEYFSEDYDEEREMEPRPEPRREATPTLRLRSPEILKQRKRVVRFEDATNREGNRRARNAEGIRSSKVEAREVATNGVSNDRRDGFKRSKKSSWDNNRGQKNKDRFSPYQGPNHGLLPSLLKSPKEILTTEKDARSFEPLPNMFGSKRSRDTSKYCNFHEDYYNTPKMGRCGIWV